MHVRIPVVRSRWSAVIVLAILGLAIGLATTSSLPHRSRQVVLLPATGVGNNVKTQTVLATSDPVLADASRSLGMRAGVASLRPTVTATALTARVFEITAQATSAADARRTAVAVATSFLRYSASHSPSANPQHAVLLDPPVLLPHASWLRAAVFPAAVGILSGAAVGLLLLLISGRLNGPRRRRMTLAHP